MFKRNTVIVVGAGGSYEVGLPIGDGLARKISEKLSFPPGSGGHGGDKVLDAALHNLASSRNLRDMQYVFKTANELSRSMPLALSIDNYLHTHSSNSLIVDIGKLAIARCVLEAERKSDLYCELHDKLDFTGLQKKYQSQNRTSSWHNTFFKMLTENVKKDNLNSVFEKISIITFNYDRCIEHYLAHAFSQYMGISPSESRVLCSKLEIIHPYGKVGDLSAGLGTFVAFGADLQREQLVAASRQIRTFTEQVIEEDTIDRMRRQLSEAENIVFLGFSYGEMNLKLMETSGDREQRNVIGTAVGISESNRAHIDERLRAVLKLGHQIQLKIHLENSRCFEVINDFSRLLLS